MDSGKAAELAIFISCMGILIIYNCLYFTKWFQSLRFRWNKKSYLNLWSVATEARTLWVGAMLANPAEGITTAQTVRNMVMGVSVLAAGITLLASQLLLLITDTARLEQVAKYTISDPISGGNALMAPQTKLGIALGTLFLSLLAMTQCVRLSVHLTYLIRAAPVDPRRQRRFSQIAFAVNRRASFYFSIGLRLQYAFFPLALYILGPLALLITTVVEVIALFLMDLTPDHISYMEGIQETEQELGDSLCTELVPKNDEEQDGEYPLHVGSLSGGAGLRSRNTSTTNGGGGVNAVPETIVSV